MDLLSTVMWRHGMTVSSLSTVMNIKRKVLESVISLRSGPVRESFLGFFYRVI